VLSSTPNRDAGSHLGKGGRAALYSRGLVLTPDAFTMDFTCGIARAAFRKPAPALALGSKRPFYNPCTRACHLMHFRTNIRARLYVIVHPSLSALQRRNIPRRRTFVLSYNIGLPVPLTKFFPEPIGGAGVESVASTVIDGVNCIVDMPDPCWYDIREWQVWPLKR